jgi:hypothetical protein
MDPEQISISHIQQDTNFCQLVSKACTDAGFFSYHEEFDIIEKPAWKNIKKEIQALENSSITMKTKIE